MLKGRHGNVELETKESKGQMIQRVMPELMGMKNILVINDEAHHCYCEKPADDADFTDDHGQQLKAAELTEAKKAATKENEAARVWISGLEAVNRLQQHQVQLQRQGGGTTYGVGTPQSSPEDIFPAVVDRDSTDNVTLR